MARSIYCSTCKKEKEPGRDNESRCKACKSQANKEKRARKRAEAGLEPYGSGRSIYCCDCKAVKEKREYGYCNACRRKKDNENRIAKGVTKKHQTGLCPCGAERASYSKSYCTKCLSERAKQRKIWLDYTEEQKERRLLLQRQRYIKKRVPKKIRLDPDTWIKPVKVKKIGTRENNVPVLCSRPNCNNTENLLSNGWCKSCHAAYYRERRKYIEDSEHSLEQKLRHNVRALTRAYIKAGKLIKQPCEVCNTENDVQAHHDDYGKPLDVRWLCRTHHREHHRNELIKDK